MKAAIVTIGDELLIGQVIDTNSVFIGSMLEEIGCSVVEKTSVSDTETAIFETMSRYQNQVDLVILTGGLRSEEHTSELQSRPHLVCRLLLEKKKKKLNSYTIIYIQ